MEKTPESQSSEYSGATLIVIYDGNCPVCQRAKAELEKLDWAKRLQFLPLQDKAVLQNYPALSRSELEKSMHVVRQRDGQVFTGARAFGEIGRVISIRSPQGLGLRLFSILMGLPGLLPVAEWVYEKIARNRYWLSASLSGGCSSGVCSLNDSPRDEEAGL